MSAPKEVAVGSIVYFWFAANTTAGSAGDGATPLYDVRKAGDAAEGIPTASGTPTLLTHANYSDGLHEIAIDTTGYTVGSEYAVFCTLTISSVNPAGFVGSLIVRAAASTLYENVVNIQSRLPAALTANGNMKSSLMEILTTVLTETVGLLAGGFKKLFNVAAPTGTLNSLPDAVPGASNGLFRAGANAGVTSAVVDLMGDLSGSVGYVTGAVGSVTGSVGSLGAQAKLDVNAEVDTALADYDGPTKAEQDAAFTEIKGATWAAGTDTLELIRDKETDIDTKTTNLPTDPADESLIIAATDAIVAAIAALNNLSAAQVNAEVVDALATDTYAEPGQEAPAATNTLAKKIGYLFKAWRNKSTQDATTYKLYADDAATVDQKATTSDDATTFTKGEVGTGP